jgi:hypothetical protein
MQSAMCLHHGIANPSTGGSCLSQSDAFSSANRVFHAHAHGRKTMMFCLLQRGKVTPRGFFLGWQSVTAPIIHFGRQIASAEGRLIDAGPRTLLLL